jgi:hypothetical protein
MTSDNIEAISSTTWLIRKPRLHHGHQKLPVKFHNRFSQITNQGAFFAQQMKTILPRLSRTKELDCGV